MECLSSSDQADQPNSLSPIIMFTRPIIPTLIWNTCTIWYFCSHITVLETYFYRILVVRLPSYIYHIFVSRLIISSVYYSSLVHTSCVCFSLTSNHPPVVIALTVCIEDITQWMINPKSSRINLTYPNSVTGSYWLLSCTHVLLSDKY